MMRCDAVVVGGGPAGSTAARVLRRAGWDVVVVDRARFPRDKVCAGWVTPEVFQLLELDPGEYRASGLTIQAIRGFRTGVIGGSLIDTRYPDVVSYAIRRCEFDDFLLRRAGARVLDGVAVENLRPSGNHWVVNDEIEAPVVIGAGGHFCPVARQVRGGAEVTVPVVAKEVEFALPNAPDGLEGEVPELFFCRDLEGYGWCVRKGQYLNVGIGRRTSREFASHVKHFCEFVEARHAVDVSGRVRWRGHAYLATGAGQRPLIDRGVLLVGDAAGLAYPESGEGIRPAVESGRAAAETLIAARGRVERDALQPYAELMRQRYPPSRPVPLPLRSASTAVGRLLMGSPVFARYVLLDRWFLRRSPTPQRVRSS